MQHTEVFNDFLPLHLPITCDLEKLLEWSKISDP